MTKLGGIEDGLYGYEDLNDMTFNFRDPKQGLNLDFTSYAMFSLANKDPKALLNASAMEALANKTFSTFFQHFVSSNLSMDAGSWVYQPIGAQLPPDTGPLQRNDGNLAVDRPDPHPIPPTNRTAVAEVSTPVEMLRTNAVAVWLSVAILIWLVGTTVLVAIVQKSRSKRLLRNVECVADVLVLVAGSRNLLRLVREQGIEAFEGKGRFVARLGWFEGSDGEARWGVEVFEKDGTERESGDES
ncbi:hypothetical protein SLS54_003562 [Diplodia seriata]